MTRTYLQIAAIGTMVTALAAGLLVPADAVQGDVGRLMYVHVPGAWLAYLSFLVTLTASIAFLVTRKMRWDRIAVSSAEIGVYFTGLTIALGMIWAKPIWGVWWTWDARLILTAVMFFVYLGYLALRKTMTDPAVRAKRSAVFGILAAVQIPIVHFSVEWWRSLHQPATIIRPDASPQIDPPLFAALMMGVAAFTVAYGALMAVRVELAKVDEAIDAAHNSHAVVAGDAVGRPNLKVDIHE